MGNAPGKREGKDGSPMSPTKEFGPKVFMQQPSLDENIDLQDPQLENLLTKNTGGAAVGRRPRSSTVSEATQPTSNSQALPVVFKWDGAGKDIYVSGPFNNWQRIPMNKSHSNFTAIVDLPEGEYEYRFHVDGQWRHSEKQTKKTNDAGTISNVVKVQKSDFEIFEALAIDSSTTKTKEYLSGSPPGEYGQAVPSKDMQQRPEGPPILPPHLLQVILNKDIGPQYEPALLPEPDHVMLNHLYALSIKDGVMVLSATHRYRKKYVTSLMYKPL